MSISNQRFCEIFEKEVLENSLAFELSSMSQYLKSFCSRNNISYNSKIHEYEIQTSDMNEDKNTFIQDIEALNFYIMLAEDVYKPCTHYSFYDIKMFSRMFLNKYHLKISKDSRI